MEKASSTCTAKASAATQKMEVFLFGVTKTNKGDPKLSKTANVVHDVDQECNLSDLKSLIRNNSSRTTVYAPGSGLYWLRKGSKQLVQLSSEADLANCKKEYGIGKDNSIRIACCILSPDAKASRK